jgi:very-short-patch-repair endonuclease
MVKNLKNQRERLSRGERPIPSSFLGGLSEKEHRKIYDNNCKLGIIYALHKYSPKQILCMNDIAERIGWKRCTVKNNLLNGLLKNGILKTSIKKGTYPGTKKGSVYFSLNNPAFSELTFEELKRLYQNSAITNIGPNKSEAAILELCLELYPDKFRFNGTRISKNRVGDRYYPDIVCTDYPIIIEHCGSWVHCDLEKEKQRVKFLENCGYYVLIIWDYDEKRRNIIKRQIKEFVDNAIQNIQ